MSATQRVNAVWDHAITKVVRLLVGLILLARDLGGLAGDVVANAGPAVSYFFDHWIGLVGLVVLLTLVPWRSWVRRATPTANLAENARGETRDSAVPESVPQAPEAGEPPIRIRLADPPDDTKESHLDWAHISVTNDTEDDVAVSVMGSWGDRRAEFEWENANDLTVVIPRQQKRRFAFVTRLRDGGKPFAYRGWQFAPGTCYVCDRVFHNSDVPGETLPPGRHQFRVEAYPKGLPIVSRRFDVYVPVDNAKSLWVVPRGRSGNE